MGYLCSSMKHMMKRMRTDWDEKREEEGNCATCGNMQSTVYYALLVHDIVLCVYTYITIRVAPSGRVLRSNHIATWGFMRGPRTCSEYVQVQRREEKGEKKNSWYGTYRTAPIKRRLCVLGALYPIASAIGVIRPKGAPSLPAPFPARVADGCAALQNLANLVGAGVQHRGIMIYAISGLETVSTHWRGPGRRTKERKRRKEEKSFLGNYSVHTLTTLQSSSRRCVPPLVSTGAIDISQAQRGPAREGGGG